MRIDTPKLAIQNSVATSLVTTVGWSTTFLFGLACGVLMLAMEVGRPLVNLPTATGSQTGRSDAA